MQTNTTTTQIVATLSASLVVFIAGCGKSKDPETPPKPTSLSVVATTPSGGATGVDLQPTMQIRFSGVLDCSTVSKSSIMLEIDGHFAPADVSCSGDTASLITIEPLLAGEECAVRVSTEVRGIRGESLAQPFELTFRTVEDLAGVTASIQARLETLRGDELQQTKVSDQVAPGLDYTIAFLGFSLCVPPDLFAMPDSEPTPGETIYGCANQVDVQAKPMGGTVQFCVAVPSVYVDLEGSLSLGGDISGYMLATQVLVTFSYSLEAQSNNRYRLGPLVEHHVSLGEVQVSSDNLLLNSFAAVLIKQLEPSILGVLDGFVAELAKIAASEAPEFVL